MIPFNIPLVTGKETIYIHQAIQSRKFCGDGSFTKIPEGFNIHPKLKKFLEKRRDFLNELDEVDWAFAETLAFGSLLIENTPVRLSGQDSVRGTFSQRHLALTDINSGEEYIPLNFMKNSQAHIEALDSFLRKQG